MNYEEIKSALSRADRLISDKRYAEAHELIAGLLANEGLTVNDMHASGRIHPGNMKAMSAWARRNGKGKVDGYS